MVGTNRVNAVYDDGMFGPVTPRTAPERREQTGSSPPLRTDDESLTFVGDVLVVEPLRSEIRFDTAWIGNLEGPITRCTRALRGKIALRSGGLDNLRALGRLPVALGIANNHLMDFGRDGYLDTIGELTRAGIGWFGAGSDEDNYANPLLLDCGGRLVALSGYVAPETHPAAVDGVGPALLTTERILEDAATARRLGASRVVVYLHWGTEECDLPAPSDRALVRKLVSAGVDLIVGHHSHCPQAFETIDGRPVYYGLGNLIMPDLKVSIRPVAGGGQSDFYCKRQMPWNQRSLIVHWNAETGIATLNGARYRRGLVRPEVRTEWVPTMGEPGEAYEQQYDRARRLARWRGRLAAAAAAPARTGLAAMARLAGRLDFSPKRRREASMMTPAGQTRTEGADRDRRRSE